MNQITPGYRSSISISPTLGVIKSNRNTFQIISISNTQDVSKPKNRIYHSFLIFSGTILNKSWSYINEWLFLIILQNSVLFHLNLACIPQKPNWEIKNRSTLSNYVYSIIASDILCEKLVKELPWLRYCRVHFQSWRSEPNLSVAMPTGHHAGKCRRHHLRVFDAI